MRVPAFLSWVPLLLHTRPALFIKGVVANFTRHDAQAHAAAVAFYTLFSFAPLVMLVFNLGASLGGGIEGDLIRFFDEQLGPRAAEVTQSVVARAQADSAAQGGAGSGYRWALSIVLLLASASAIFGELQSALNTIWEVDSASGAPAVRKRSGLWAWLRRRLISMGMVLTTLFILLVSLVLTSAVQWLMGRAGTIEGALARAVDIATSLVVPTLLFAALFRFLPDTAARLPWRLVFKGAVVTAVLFAVGKAVLGVYLARESVTRGYADAAGALVALTVWVYYSATILFIGAEITRQLGADRAGTHPASPSQPR